MREHSVRGTWGAMSVSCSSRSSNPAGQHTSFLTERHSVVFLTVVSIFECLHLKKNQTCKLTLNFLYLQSLRCFTARQPWFGPSVVSLTIQIWLLEQSLYQHACAQACEYHWQKFQQAIWFKLKLHNISASFLWNKTYQWKKKALLCRLRTQKTSRLVTVFSPQTNSRHNTYRYQTD